MPSATADRDRSSEAVEVARRYQRLERPLSYTGALPAAVLVVGCVHERERR